MELARQFQINKEGKRETNFTHIRQNLEWDDFPSGGIGMGKKTTEELQILTDCGKYMILSANLYKALEDVLDYPDDEFNKLTRENAELKEKLEGEKKRIESLCGELAVRDAEIANHIKETTDLHGKVVKLGEVIRERKKGYQNLTAENKQLKKSNEELAAENQQLLAIVNPKECAAMNARLDTATKLTRMNLQKLNEKNQQLVAANHKIEALELENRNLKAQLANNGGKPDERTG